MYAKVKARLNLGIYVSLDAANSNKSSILAMQRIELPKQLLGWPIFDSRYLYSLQLQSGLVGDHYCLEKFFFVFQKYQNKLASLNSFL